ncbi:MAG: undecaprenyl/decaprenyl-phosphate alpha-N-acetylglucosaminyl 1-phosphate transferase [Candidatus Buchananbacteria bacterium]|nr:undecaprenyl/decaprenyl-phosphate alpha-N-acetylglucosaminyl 1-phosphate transferase [Candidatus Buchananbacteria bacterium]
MIYLLAVLTGTAFSLILTPFIRKLALHHQIVDLPNPRKIHSTPTPLLGGLAIFFAFFFSTLIFWFAGYIEDSRITQTQVLAILCAGAALMIGGVLDDKFNLKPAQQIIWPLIAIALMITAGVKIQFVTNPLGGVLEFSSLLGVITASLWILGMIYTTKFLDGLDGLVAGITTIGATIIFIVSLYWDVPLSGTSILSLILAGSCLGFLVFNWHPAKIFLGEGGSIFCGFMLGTLAIISGSKIATALLIMGVPILDVAWVIVRRIWEGRSPVSADRKHLHFRLLDIGLNHRQSVIVLYLITIAFGTTSLWLHSKGKIIALGILGIFMVLLITSLVWTYQQKIKNDQATKN